MTCIYTQFPVLHIRRYILSELKNQTANECILTTWGLYVHSPRRLADARTTNMYPKTTPQIESIFTNQVVFDSKLIQYPVYPQLKTLAYIF
jgi:hypothetical protein